MDGFKKFQDHHVQLVVEEHSAQRYFPPASVGQGIGVWANAVAPHNRPPSRSVDSKRFMVGLRSF
jgi:hypothetical protein